MQMNEVIEAQAKIVAEQLLLQGKSEQQAVRLMIKSTPEWPGITRAQALEVIAAVKREWLEVAEPTREEYRALQVRRLDHLYDAAFTSKRFSTCLQVQKLLAEIHGTLAPKKVDLRIPAGSGADAEFEDRSQFELEYYADHGRWPPEDDGAEERAVH